MTLRSVRSIVVLLALVFTVSLLGKPSGAGQADVPSPQWPMFGGDAQHRSVSPHAGPANPETAWSFPLGELVRDTSSPVVGADGTVYIGTWDGGLFAINPDGTEKWQSLDDTLDDLIISAPALSADGSSVYVLNKGFQAWLTALDAQDGSVLWDFEVDNTTYGSPTVGPDGTIYFGARALSPETSHLFAINPDGTLKWAFDTGSTTWIETSVALGPGGEVYFAQNVWGLTALDSAGELLWNLPVATDWVHPSVGPDGTIYLSSDGGGTEMLAVNPDGTIKWSEEVESQLGSSMAAQSRSGATLYQGDVGGRFYAFDAASGDIKWFTDLDSDATIGAGATVSDNGLIYVSHSSTGDPVDGLTALDVETGAVVWSRAIGPNSATPALAVDGTLYAIGDDENGDGVLYAFRDRPATQLAFANASFSLATTGIALPEIPIVEVRNSLGEVVIGDDRTVVTLEANAGGLSCTGGLSRQVENGVATFPGCTFQAPNAGIQIFATATGLSGDDLGPFDVTGPGPETGLLRVVTQPALPSIISLNGLPADGWGLDWVKLPPGEYVVSFSDVPGWTTPRPERFVVVEDETTTFTAVFEERGQLRVITDPPVPATIRVDGEPVNDWGSWTDVPPGVYEVCFGLFEDYAAPACQDATVEAGEITVITGEYVADEGAPGPFPSGLLRVQTVPAAASQVVIDGVIRTSWGLDWVQLAPGTYTVQFTDIPDWGTPASQTVQVSTGSTSTVVGTLVQYGWLRVITSPAVPSTISIDGLPRDDWGLWIPIAPGSYEVCFGDVDGFGTPACETAVVEAGVLETVTGLFD